MDIYSAGFGSSEYSHESYEYSREWSDTLINQALRLMAPHIITIASDSLDMHHATDLVVTRPARIAYRMRNLDLRYRNEFTIRSKRPNREETELQKIIKCRPEYMYYGMHEDGIIKHWLFLDLHVFADCIIDSILGIKPIPYLTKSNKDKSSEFQVYSIQDFPKELVIEQGSRSSDFKC